MADTQVVKKPAGGAFGQFLNANRPSLAERATKEGLKGFSAVSKVASQAWKELSDADKAPYEVKFKEAQAAYGAYKKSDGFVAPVKKEKKGKRGKDGKKKKDPEAPKKPVGGAYGIFSAEKRAEFTKAVEAKGEKGFGPVARMTSEAWKALSAEEKNPYQEKFAKAQGEHKAAFGAYREKKAAEEPKEEEQATPSKAKAGRKATPKAAPKAPKQSGRKAADATAAAPKAPKKGGRKAADATAAAADGDVATPQKPAVPAAKRGRNAAGPALSEELLLAAEKVNLRTALENLAKRPEIVEQNCDGEKMLKALKQAGGMVNKAKSILLGC